MFKKGYSFKYIQGKKPKGEDVFICNHIFSFLCNNNNKYIVNVEEYPYSTFIIKFYLQAHSKLDDKYNRLTGFKDTSKILKTCIDILLFFYNKNPYSSFGFVGAFTVEEGNKPSNKRFRVYKGIMTRFFSPVKFTHISYPNKNLYFLVNKDSSKEDLAKKIIDFFSKHYTIS